MKYASPILVALFLIYTTGLAAQHRVDRIPGANKPAATFIKKSPLLTSVTGWCQNKKTGKWVSNHNRILDLPLKQADPDDTITSFGGLGTAAISYKNRKYYLVYYLEKIPRAATGENAPVLIEEIQGTKFEPDYTFFLLTDSFGYFTFKRKIFERKGTNITLESATAAEYGRKGPYSDTKILTQIAEVLDNPSPIESQCLFANSQILDRQNIVRFVGIDACTSSPKLETSYYEVPLSDFRKIFVE